MKVSLAELKFKEILCLKELFKKKFTKFVIIIVLINGDHSKENN